VPISPFAERTRLALYVRLASTGTASSIDQLADELEAETSEIDAALAELADAHHVVLKDGEVVLAHPFATRSFASQS
jgi:hypothetical protein